MKYRYLTIEGNIGAGKTSLAKMLAGDLKGKLILEQFADNPFLPHFYKNPKQYAFPLELFFLAERYQQLKDESATPDLFNSFVITDYLFAKSHLFAGINLNNEELKLFQRLATIMQTSLPDPDVLIYLHSPVEKLMQNISKRGRAYEKNISPDYLQRIQNGYFDFFKSQLQMRIAVIDVSQIDFVNNKSGYELLKDIINLDFEYGTKFITPK